MPLHIRTNVRLKNAGFTLLEIVLALALSSGVLYLLTTALEQFMFRVDSSRSRVEAAQVARAVLDAIASDLASMRVAPPPRSSSGGGGNAGQGASAGQGSAGGQANSQSASGANSQSANSSSSSGLNGSSAPLVGTETELRFNRSAPRGWERLTRVLEQDEQTATDAFPCTVRYWLNDEDRRTAAALAATGVSPEASARISGLYRDVMATLAVAETTQSAIPAAPGTLAETALPELCDSQLLAPEVVGLEFAYYDGTNMLTEWDPTATPGLPKAIRVTLKVLETSYEEAVESQRSTQQERRSVSERNLVTYRRFVTLPAQGARPPDQMLLRPNQQQGQNGQPPGGQQGQGGQGQAGGASNNGANTPAGAGAAGS